MSMLAALIISVFLGGALWLAGAGEHDAQVLVLASLGGMVVVTLAVRALRHERALIPWDWRWGLPLLGLLVLVAIQTLNASHYFILENRALVPQTHVGLLPRGVDRFTTFWALGLISGYAASFWLARVWLVGRSERRFFVMTQLVCGAALALLVLQQRQSPPPGALYPVTGTVVNSNHYAAYANVMLALALAWAADCWTSIWHRGLRLLAAGALVTVAVLLLGSVVRSGSRMGVLVAAFVVAGVAVVSGVRGGVGRRVVLAVFAVGIAVLLIWGSVRGLQGCEGGWSVRQFAGNAVSRFEAQWAVLSMIPDRWLAGYGAGTFEKVFPYYQPRSLPGAYRHAHNDYLQCLVELGVAGVLLLMWFVWGSCFRPDSGSSQHPLTFWERTGIVLGLGALALHALTDFPFRLPALSLLAAVLVGMSGGQIWGPLSKDKTCE